MPFTTVPLPYGLRQVMVAPLSSADVIGTKVALPNARTLTFTEGSDSSELRGDDKVVAVRDSGPQVTWELEEGGISLEAYVVIAGGAVTVTGTTPNQIKTYTKLGADRRPYFYLEGRAISDSGGDLHCYLPKCKADGDLGGEMNDGEWWLTGASGRAVPSTSVTDTDVAYKFVQNETAVAIT